MHTAHVNQITEAVQKLEMSGLRFRPSQSYAQFEEKADLYVRLGLDKALLPSELAPEEESFYDQWLEAHA
jgi:uncharacterized membrane-anchored protein